MSGESLIIPCPACGTKNRVPFSRMGEGPVCGRCKAKLPAGTQTGRPVDVSDADFSREVLSHGGLVLVDCWAPWCGPCKMVAPVLDEIARDFTGQVKVAKLNVDENPATASQYGIQSIPTMILFSGGREKDRLVGALPKQGIEGLIKRHL